MSETFSTLGLSSYLVQVLDQQQISKPTPIQQQAIPALLNGENILGLASTGSGKTLAFGLPMLEKLNAKNSFTQALILCPTRELANQVAGEIRKFTKEHESLFTAAVYGGESMERQIRMLRQGAQVVVGTPGRIIDHLNRGTLKLENLSWLVLDEADEMLSMGFEEDIRAILEFVKTSPQVALFSATMSKSILSIASGYLGNYRKIEIEASLLSRPDIKEYFLDVYSEDKAEVVLRLIRFYGLTRCIAFCNTKIGTDKLVQQLGEKGFPAEAIHGDMAQLQRTSVMRKFKTGQVPLLVATDVAARGIDVQNVEAVFNADIPRDTEFYVHRIGRTGRAGKSGLSFALVMKSDFRQLKNIERFSGNPMERIKIPSLQAIALKQQADFLQELRQQEPDLSWMSAVEQMESEGLNVREILAGMIARQMGPVPPSDDQLLDKISRDKDKRTEGKSRDFSGKFPSEGKFIPRKNGFTGRKTEGRDTEKMVSIRFNIGRNARIRPADLVGAIASEANVSGRRLGYIGIEERYSLVDVPADLAKQIVKAMAGNVVRGKKVKVELA
jgi:ATP-dependent RNA helicase DeaD